MSPQRSPFGMTTPSISTSRMAMRPAMREGESQRRLSSNAARASEGSERSSWY